MGGRAERIVQRALIDLNYRAVYLKAEIMTFRTEFFYRLDSLFYRRNYTAERSHRKPPSAERLDHSRVSLKSVASDAARVVDDHVERTRRNRFRIEKLERAGAGVARIHKGLAAGLVKRGVELNESVARHENLAANLKRFGSVLRKRLGNRTYRADILRHVVADLAVAARRGPDENATLV